MSEMNRPLPCEDCEWGGADLLFCSAEKIAFALNELKLSSPILRLFATRHFTCPNFKPITKEDAK